MNEDMLVLRRASSIQPEVLDTLGYGEVDGGCFVVINGIKDDFEYPSDVMLVQASKHIKIERLALVFHGRVHEDLIYGLPVGNDILLINYEQLQKKLI